MYSISLDTYAGQAAFNFETGKITLIVGPNGVGKSALLYNIYRHIGQSAAVYLPGHRTITFTHGYDNLQMSLIDLERNLYSQTEAFNRYKSQWSEEQFKSVVRRLHHSQTVHNQKIIDRIRQGELGEELVRLRNSPLEIINYCFSAARMVVRFGLSDGGIVALRDGAEYSIDQLSDGERAALFIVGAVLVTSENRVLVIDEPERHLHPSISGPLISTAVRFKPELAYVFASHDLSLIESLNVDQFLFVRNSLVISVRPETRRFDIVRLDSLDDVADDLKRDILGARDRVLFVEGEATSLDRALYTAAYPNWKVSPRGGAEKVIEATSALQQNASLHWLHALGLIDGDGREEAERSALRLRNIDVLSVPSIENLFFMEPVVRTFCRITSDLEGGSADDRLNNVQQALRSLIVENRQEIVARRVTWAINRRLAESKVSVSDVRGASLADRVVEVQPIISSVEQSLDEFLQGPCTLKELIDLPIKATPIPARIAALAGAQSLKKYKDIVLRQIELNSPYGEMMLSAVRERLPALG